jgi:hypothetical protein
MTPQEFSERIDSFRRGTALGKNLYLWCANLGALEQIIGEDAARVDLLELCTPEFGPGTSKIRRRLEESLGHRLQEIASGQSGRSIALIDGLALGAHYRVQLEQVYQHHANDRRLTVLCASPGRTLTHVLPGSLAYDPFVSQNYYRQMLAPGQIVEEAGNGTNSP